MTWPPKELARVLPLIDLWGAWYSGDPNELSRIYSRNLVRPRDSQFRGGLQGIIARAWWGQPVTTSTREKMHMPLAADIAAASSDLLFAEELQISPADEGGDLTRLNQILDDNNWQSLLPESSEVCSAYGGVYLRVGWDTAVQGSPIISTFNGQGAWPTFVMGRLTQVTFWTRVNSDSTVFDRLLERHVPGRIEYSLYRGTEGELGRLIPLSAATISASLPVDAEGGINTGTNGLTAVYVPNVRPAPMWQNDAIGQHLGRADVSGSESFLDGIDETWTSWMRDIRHGKSRIIAPRSFMEQGRPGDSLWFNMEQDLFIPANTGATLDVPLKDQLSVQQFTIRTAEHAATIKGLMGVVVRRAGYSAQTFDIGGAGAVTATEVNSRDRRSMNSREKKSRYWTTALERLLLVVQEIDAAVFHGPTPTPVDVSFPAPAQSPEELARTVQLLDAARAVSIDTRVRMVHPDWDDTRVQQEVQGIISDSAVSIPEAGDFVE